MRLILDIRGLSWALKRIYEGILGRISDMKGANGPFTGYIRGLFYDYLTLKEM